MVRHLDKMLSPLRRKLRLMVSRAVVSLVDDAKKRQVLQVSGWADETLDGVEHIQAYGFTAHPFEDADAVVLNVGGQRSHPIVIAVEDRRYRLQGMAQGEVALYTDEGDKIHLKRGGIIEMKATSKVNIIAPDSEFSGNVKVGGKLDVVGAATFASTMAVTGAATFSSVVAAPTVTATVGLSVAGVEMGGHAHGGVQAGVDVSGGPQ